LYIKRLLEELEIAPSTEELDAALSKIDSLTQSNLRERLQFEHEISGA
jgi:hypothetical protein